MGLPPESTPRVLAHTTTTTTRVRVHLVVQSALDWRLIKVQSPTPPTRTRPDLPSRTPGAPSTDETLDDKDDRPTSTRTLLGRRRSEVRESSAPQAQRESKSESESKSEGESESGSESGSKGESESERKGESESERESERKGESERWSDAVVVRVRP